MRLILIAVLTLLLACGPFDFAIPPPYHGGLSDFAAVPQRRNPARRADLRAAHPWDSLSPGGKLARLKQHNGWTWDEALAYAADNPGDLSDPVNLDDQLGEAAVREWLALDKLNCQRDFYYWLRNYGTIIDEDTGQVIIGIALREDRPDPFGRHTKQWGGQRAFLDPVLRGENVISGKARQDGWSWLLENYEYWKLEHQDNRRIQLYHRTDEDTMKHLERVNRIRLHQPPWIAIKEVVTKNNHELALGTPKKYSTMTADSVSEGAGRGLAADLVHIEEFAFWPAKLAEEVYTALRATAGDKARQIVIISTANGQGNKYSELWHKAYAGADDNAEARTSFTAVFLPWYINPDRDAPWYQMMEIDLGPRLVCQEYPSTPEEMFARIGGAIYPNFSVAIHCGEPEYDPGLPLYIGGDFGFENYSAIYFCQVSPEDQLRVLDEIYVNHKSGPQLAQMVLDKLADDFGIYVGNRLTPSVFEQLTGELGANYDPWRYLSVGYGDPSATGWIADFDEMGLPLLTQTRMGNKLNDVGAGIATVRKLIDRTDMPGLMIHKRNCPVLVRQLPQYHYNPRSRKGDEPNKVEDHGPDGLRYQAHGELGDAVENWVIGEVMV